MLRLWFGIAVGVAALRLPCAWCGEEAHPAHPPAAVVETAPGGQAKVPERIELNTVFQVHDGEHLWRRAWARAIEPIPALSQPVSAENITPQGFDYVKGFRVECYEEKGSPRRILYTILAGEARADGRRIKLSKVLISYLTEGSAVSALTEAAGPAKPETSSQQRRGRMVISADEGSFLTDSGVVRAQGHVRLEMFSGVPEEDREGPMGVMQSSELTFRAWRDPTDGSFDLAIYIAGERPEDDGPAVTGAFKERQPGGGFSNMELRAKGMILESSILDHLEPRLFEDRQLGVTGVRLRRIVFHKEIAVRTTGKKATSLIPFQRDGQPPAEGAEPVTATETTVTHIVCNGPAILDLAANPRRVDPQASEQEMALSRRFEFLNGVSMKSETTRTPAEGAPAPPPQLAEVQCRHMCLQYAPELLAPSSPNPKAGDTAAAESSRLPEYAEGVGGVLVKGTKAPAPGAPAGDPAKPFVIDCQRIYYDAATDLLNLEGLPGTPIELTDELGELRAQVCAISRRTQVMSMPVPGKKELLVRPGALKRLAQAAPPKEGQPVEGAPEKAPAAPGFDLGAGDLKIVCWGPVTVEAVATPEPGDPARTKDILRLAHDVVIEQPSTGMKMEAQKVHIVLDGRTKQPEVIRGEEKMTANLEGMKVKGKALEMNLSYAADGTVAKHRMAVDGESEQFPAILWQAGSAMASRNFVMDGLTKSLWAEHGAVARAELPEPPKDAQSPAASAGVFNMSGGGKVHLQCDGPLHYDGKAGRLYMEDRVAVLRSDMSITAQRLHLHMDLTPPEAKAGKEKPGQKPQDAGPEGSGIMGGKPKILECIGGVEVLSPGQVIHSDQLFYDLPANKAFLTTFDPKEFVRVYLKQPGGTTQLLEVPHRLDYDGQSGVFTPETYMLLRPYDQHAPMPRGTGK